MDLIILPLIWIANAVLNIYFWVVIGAVVSSWLVTFGVINTKNDFVRTLLDVLYRLTEPVFATIRRVLPTLSGIDFSPIVVLIGLEAFRYFLNLLAVKLVMVKSGI